MLKGTWLMIGSVLIFTVLLILIRLVGEGVSVFTVVVVRQVIMQAVILMVTGPHVRTLLHTNNLQLQLWRSALALGSTLGIYVSFIYLPLALASAISFSAVLFVTMGAAVFLKEKVDGKTWAATIIGLVGVVIMLSPREGGDLFYILVAIAGAIVSAGTILTVRVFHPSESIGTVLTYQGVLVIPVLLVPMLLTWQMPTPTEWLLLLLIGLVSTAGHWTFVAAYRHAEAARLAPLDFCASCCSRSPVWCSSRSTPNRRCSSAWPSSLRRRSTSSAPTLGTPRPRSSPRKLLEKSLIEILTIGDGCAKLQPER